MDWVALSSRYYMDLDDLGVSESAQTLLTRAMAYMALNETGGFLAKSALNKLGLTRVSRRVDELIRVKVMVERVDVSGYDFPAWLKWNAPLEAQVKKRKADRERIAEKRSAKQNVARQSGDVSRDVASPPHTTTQRSPKGDLSTTGLNARADGKNGGRTYVDRANATARSVRANTLANTYANECHGIDRKTLTGIAQAIDQCLEYPDDVILEGVRAWAASPMVSPTQIASFMHKVRARAAPHRSTADERVAQAQALKSNGNGNVMPLKPRPLELQ